MSKKLIEMDGWMDKWPGRRWGICPGAISGRWLPSYRRKLPASRAASSSASPRSNSPGYKQSLAIVNSLAWPTQPTATATAAAAAAAAAFLVIEGPGWQLAIITNYDRCNECWLPWSRMFLPLGISGPNWAVQHSKSKMPDDWSCRCR